jgi:hypothetical protein
VGKRSATRESTERSGKADATVKPPLHPLWVSLIAVLLPGVGQVINNTPKRGLMFVFFMMSLGWVTLHLAPPEASFVGRYAGGFFIYAISVMDAYRWARYRWTFFRLDPGSADSAARSPSRK